MITTLIRNKPLWLFILFLLPVFAVLAQTEDKDKIVYLDLNRPGKSVHEVPTEVLSIQYNDYYGRTEVLPFTIYNAKREVVARFELAKTFGINHFNIELDDVYSGWEKKRLYTCEAKDENGHMYELLIRLIEMPKSEITANIFVNPKYLTCDDISGNLVEFYGEIEGGKPPYTVRWYVMNDQRSSFLYQPRTQRIEKAGSTASIQVDKSPEYYVIMDVHDTCGNEQHQVVSIVCKRNKKKVNTVFFESVHDLVKDKTIN